MEGSACTIWTQTDGVGLRGDKPSQGQALMKSEFGFRGVPGILRVCVGMTGWMLDSELARVCNVLWVLWAWNQASYNKWMHNVQVQILNWGRFVQSLIHILCTITAHGTSSILQLQKHRKKMEQDIPDVTRMCIIGTLSRGDVPDSWEQGKSLTGYMSNLKSLYLYMSPTIFTKCKSHATNSYNIENTGVVKTSCYQ